MRWCRYCSLSLAWLVVAILGCGGGGGNSTNPTPPVVNLNPSAIYSGDFGPSSNAANDVTQGIILPSGEARLMLRYGSQIVGNLQVSGSDFSCSASMFTPTGLQSFTISNGKINQTITSGQANLSGSFATAGMSDTFTLYSRQNINDPTMVKSLNSLVGSWRAEANNQTSSVYSQGYISGSVDTGGNLTATISSGGTVTALFTQISPGANAFRVTVQCNGQTYIGLAYTQVYAPNPDGFLTILASNATGQFYAVFHH